MPCDEAPRPEGDEDDDGNEEREGVEAVEEGFRGGEVAVVALPELDGSVD